MSTSLKNEQHKEKNQNEKSISLLLFKGIFWLIIAILSLGFGVSEIIAAIQKAMDISDQDTGWKKFGSTLVSILYFLEAGLFIFFIWLSSQKSIIAFKKRSKMIKDSGYVTRRAKRKMKKADKLVNEKEELKFEDVDNIETKSKKIDNDYSTDQLDKTSSNIDSNETELIGDGEEIQENNKNDLF